MVDPSSIEALTACRLIPLNKNPGIRPIGIREVLRRIIGKSISWVLRDEIQEVAGPLQVATGLNAGAEASIHAMRTIFAQDSTEAVILIIIIIIFISSWYKIVKSTNKNQPSTRYNYSFHATVRTKENVRLDIISSTVKTTACIYWIPIHTIQLKFYYK